MAAPQHPLFTFQEPVGLMSGANPRYPSAVGGQEGLKADLTAMGVRFQETQGRYGAEEPSLIVYGLPREHLMALGEKYGQESVIHNEQGKRQFIYTAGPNAGKYHPGLPEQHHERWGESESPPEDYWTKVPGHGYVRLAFDFDQLHPVDQDQAAPRPRPIAVQPEPQESSAGMSQGIAAAPVGKAELLHRLHRGLEELLAKTTRKRQPRHGVLLRKAVPNPLNDLHRHAEDYRAQYGIQNPATQHRMDVPTSRRIAAAYEALGHDPQHPDVQRAYGALKQEVLQQYRHLQDQGYRFTPHGDELGQQGPYASHENMVQDLLHNRHLHVYTGGAPPLDHPLSEQLPGQDPLGTYNVAFRAIHDAYGHARAGHDFSHEGEERAWNDHLQMFTPEAQRALLTETRGQNAAFHYGQHGAGNQQDPSKAQFPEQKAGLLPAEFQHPNGNPPKQPSGQPNLEASMSDKSLTKREVFHQLHQGLRAKVQEFEKLCLGLRKAEREQLEKALGGVAMSGPASSHPAVSVPSGSAEHGGSMPMKSPPAGTGTVMTAPGSPGPGITKSQHCGACGLEKSRDHDCDTAERYAKGEKSPVPKSKDSSKPSRAVADPIKKAGNPLIIARMAANKAKAKAAQPKPQEPVQKAGLPLGNAGNPSAAAPAKPAVPKLPKLKLPVPTSAAPKMPGSSAPKAPGAGTAKAEKKPTPKRPPCHNCGQPALDHSTTDPDSTPELCPDGDEGFHRNQYYIPKDSKDKKLGKTAISPRDRSQQASKLPHVRSQVGSSMDAMLRGGAAPSAAEPPKGLVQGIRSRAAKPFTGGPPGQGTK